MNMNVKLVEPSQDLEEAYIDYISEWEARGERIVSYSSRRDSGENYSTLLERWRREQSKDNVNGLVPATLYFLLDDNQRILGSAHLRHQLNEGLLKSGGHIGYGIRPSERGRGLATKILSEALKIAESKGITKALVTCDKTNLASAKTIINNGGILENEVFDGASCIQRYWINIT